VKEDILKNAAELFLNLGFKSVTMDDIAQQMAISKKTIYAHFSTKTKLVKATVDYLIKEIDLGTTKLSSRNLNPIVETYEMKKYAMDMLKNEKSSPQFQLKKYYPEVYYPLREKQFEIVQRNVIKNLERGITSGHYKGDIPISFISRIYFVGMLGIKDKNLFPQEEYSNAKLMDYFLKYHLSSICTEKGLKTLDELLNSNKPANEN
jgi:AcrR family transcriptional regulator